MGRRKMIMDGNDAAAHIAYAFTEVAGIYPITPSSPIAERTDEWSSQGRKNIFGQPVKLVEMQSEAGAAGVVHGALEAGAFATSFTSSQGLLLMIPAMHRISGQCHPGVLHVAARTVGTHAFSIFGDHSDVMNCKHTGFSMLCTGSVQEVMDLAGVCHLAAIESSLPFMNFFDGFRTSHEIQKIEIIEYDELKEMVNWEAVQKFRDRSLNPDRPVLRSSVQNPDIYFQVREATNSAYEAIPDIVEKYMEKINKLTGKNYGLFNYYGAEDAEDIIIAMGSVSGAIKETIEKLNSEGRKVGYIQVHLYRPFSVKHFLKAIPETVKRIAVLDRLKDAGAVGEPLYTDVCSALFQTENPPEIIGGRYGLSSKDTDPAQIKAVFDNLTSKNPINNFTIGIDDDVTGRSLPLSDFTAESEKTKSCKFWGLGSDGTVGANGNSIAIIGENTDMYVQGYFEYDTKKSFGLTRSHLRFGPDPIRSSYLVKRADFIACHNQTYLEKYDILDELKTGGVFLLNTEWTKENIADFLPNKVKRLLAQKEAKFYIIDANKISNELGLGNRSNMILQSAFFALSKIIPLDQAVKYMKDGVKKLYRKKGQAVVDKNLSAIDRGLNSSVYYKVPEEWANLKDEHDNKNSDAPDFVKNILNPINAQKGDMLPVSTFVDIKDGTLPLGLTAHEKRGIATEIPVWNENDCIQCNRCSFVCPHAVIRPFLLTKEELENAPEGFKSVPAKDANLRKYSYTLQVSALDCCSCGSCADVCPSKIKALNMVKITEADVDQSHFNYAVTLSEKLEANDEISVRYSQFKQPLLEFSGACAGCGETPYVKLLTQLYGDRMYIANATGCTQAWGSAMPSIPYTVNKDGRGPAWSNSLFEDNAEFALGMCLAVKQQRETVRTLLEELSETINNDMIIHAVKELYDNFDSVNDSQIPGRKLAILLESVKNNSDKASKRIIDELLKRKEHFTKKTMWMVGGDGWAYDIGYGGLDHVFSLGEDLNVLLVDTEVYSNTGGQSSKATQLGAVAQFAASGKTTRKKELGLQLMQYDNVYVAQVAMGADMNQLVKALTEAEEHDGPSIVIAYAPCITHGIKSGMHKVQEHMKKAVEAGYWNLYRYNPKLEENRFSLDSPRPRLSLEDYLNAETRFTSLSITYPENAKKLFRQAQKAADDRYNYYQLLADTH